MVLKCTMEVYKDKFSISEYDIIGFDLDNTLARYRIREMAHLEYWIMSRFLVDNKFYPSKYLYESFTRQIDFLIKGLFLDLENGNILKLDENAKIVRCHHGINRLSPKEIVEVYGPKRHWDVTDNYVQNPLGCWNGPLNGRVRALLDYFDIAVSLLFARLITTIEECNEGNEERKFNKAQVWPDICEALGYMFFYEHFAQDKGEFFPSLKIAFHKYYYPYNQKVIDWLRELHKKKLTVLISGSEIDFASQTASYTLGEDWADLFDLVVCFAKKPGFFSGEQRPFILRDFDAKSTKETTEISSSQLTKGCVYAKGNWDGVLDFARRESGVAEPRALYFGDNMIQDVVVPHMCAGVDVVAVVEELAGRNHPDKQLITSTEWGSYMGESDVTELPSLWASWLKEHACLAISTMEKMADFPVDHVFVKDDA